jgi:hypothetical protein
MAITVYPDIVDGAGLVTLKNGGSRTTRAFFLHNVTVNDPAAFVKACLEAPGVPRNFDRHPAFPELTCTAREVKAIGGAQGVVICTYESQMIGGDPVERLAIRDTGTLSHETVRRHPGTGKLLKVYRAALSEGTPKTLEVGYPIPVRNRVLYGLFSEGRPESWKRMLGCVNNAPFMGYPTAYWLCSYYDEQWSNVDRKFRVTVGFTTKQLYDWSTYGQIRETTGEFIDVDDQTFLQIVNQPYTYGTIWQTNGVGRWGNYPLTNFGALVAPFADL